MFSHGRTTLICLSCGVIEKVDSAVMRSVGEYILLFPERKITTNDICEWCGMEGGKKTILRILHTHFRLVTKGRAAYYVKK
ncbi:hypothetical protein J2S74_003050 [Evansella vedderi]|uniref:YgiT-type zinc finger protein n=2 Tax=Evansella vedderi TaxID=38282 RepID=A0ABT9ZZ09_9BACI|nr:hypothetical protein [Evansella vedderi]